MDPYPKVELRKRRTSRTKDRYYCVMGRHRPMNQVTFGVGFQRMGFALNVEPPGGASWYSSNRRRTQKNKKEPLATDTTEKGAIPLYEE